MFIKTFFRTFVLSLTLIAQLQAMDPAPTYLLIFGKLAPQQDLSLRESFTNELRWHRTTAIGCRQPIPF